MVMGPFPADAFSFTFQATLSEGTDKLQFGTYNSDWKSLDMTVIPQADAMKPIRIQGYTCSDYCGAFTPDGCNKCSEQTFGVEEVPLCLMCKKSASSAAICADFRAEGCEFIKPKCINEQTGEVLGDNDGWLETESPTAFPTANPTVPTKQPTTLQPTNVGATSYPTPPPTKKPTRAPTFQPTKRPSKYPTPPPTQWPSKNPTLPTNNPTEAPTASPTATPTTATPTEAPTTAPTYAPTNAPLAFEVGLTASPDLLPSGPALDAYVAEVVDFLASAVNANNGQFSVTSVGAAAVRRRLLAGDGAVLLLAISGDDNQRVADELDALLANGSLCAMPGAPVQLDCEASEGSDKAKAQANTLDGAEDTAAASSSIIPIAAGAGAVVLLLVGGLFARRMRNKANKKKKGASYASSNAFDAESAKLPRALARASARRTTSARGRTARTSRASPSSARVSKKKVAPKGPSAVTVKPLSKPPAIPSAKPLVKPAAKPSSKPPSIPAASKPSSKPPSIPAASKPSSKPPSIPASKPSLPSLGRK